MVDLVSSTKALEVVSMVALEVYLQESNQRTEFGKPLSLAQRGDFQHWPNVRGLDFVGMTSGVGVGMS